MFHLPFKQQGQVRRRDALYTTEQEREFPGDAIRQRWISFAAVSGQIKESQGRAVRRWSFHWSTNAMSEHKVTVEWKRETPDFAYQSYNRDHDWTFDAGVTVRASAAPAYQGSESCVDPEEAFVASLSSCHMLTFLAIAAKKRYVVDAYRDKAVGILDKDPSGRLAIVRVTLRPEVTFSGDKTPTPDELHTLHDQAHHACFIANSVKTDVVVEPS